jgi:4-amino-4-deoxy-L-arabinose transferase-like glycosyltransferase
VSGLTVVASARVARGRLTRTQIATALVAAIVVVTVILHVVWLVRFRRADIVEWDEAGYMQFSLSNYDALRQQGPWTFAKTVAGRETFGPLFPFVTSLAYPIVGRSVFGGLLVMPLFFAGLVAATYGLARQLVSSSWAVVAALAVAAMPAVTDYTRLFHFALPATACMTAALWALVRTEGLRRTGWAVAFGVFLALTCLSRTMTAAYVPGLALAAGTQFLVGSPDLRVKARNLAFAVGAAALVAGPWYIRNARSVYDNLVGTGYGADAARYGSRHAVASWDYWTKELRLDLAHLGLPLAVALLLCFGIALGSLLARRGGISRPSRRWSARTAAVVALMVVVVEGYVALTSSRNEGTGFALPWLPALVVLAVAAAASIPSRALRVGVAGVLVAVSLGGLVSKSGWFEPLAKVREVSVPGLGDVPVTDGRGIIQREFEGAGYDIGKPTQPLPAIHREWLPLARDVVGWSLRRAEERGEPLNLVLGFDDLIFSNSRLILAAQLWYYRYLSVDYLLPFPGGDTVVSYRRQLQTSPPDNALLIGEPSPRSTITRAKVEAAARALGFVPVKSFTMPDGRRMWVWWREDARAG